MKDTLNFRTTPNELLLPLSGFYNNVAMPLG